MVGCTMHPCGPGCSAQGFVRVVSSSECGQYQGQMRAVDCVGRDCARPLRAANMTGWV